MIFKNDKVYDVLKDISLILVPLSTLIVAILTAYGYTEVERVTVVLAAINTFLGSLVKISNKKYKEEIEDESINQIK